MSIPHPDLSRLLEVHKISKNTLKRTEINGNAAQLQRNQGGTRDRALDLFLQELRNTAPEHRRPLIINLNDDCAMLICIPRPLQEAESTGKAFFYLVTDPWLNGDADFFDQPNFFLTLWHLEPEAYRSIASVEVLIRAIENAAVRGPGLSGGKRPGETTGSAPSVRPGIDAIILSNQFADHSHRPTLETADPDTPILAAQDAVPVLQTWEHFTNVWRIPNLHLGTKSPLPSWINVVRLPVPGDNLEVAHGILISWATRAAERPEAILYAPHGVAPKTVETVLIGSPAIRLLAILHPVHETVVEGTPPPLSVENGLELYRLTGARYWVQTHDGDMGRSGLLAPFQEYRERSLEEALEANPGPRPNFRARGNGEIYVLE